MSPKLLRIGSLALITFFVQKSYSKQKCDDAKKIAPSGIIGGTVKSPKSSANKKGKPKRRKDFAMLNMRIQAATDTAKKYYKYFRPRN